MLEELKPCPFCGYPAIDAGQIDSQGTLEICCSHCGAMIRELDYKQLVDEWNRRAQQPNELLTCDGCACKTNYGKCAACDYCIRHEGYKDRYYRHPPEAGGTP